MNETNENLASSLNVAEDNKDFEGPWYRNRHYVDQTTPHTANVAERQGIVVPSPHAMDANIQYFLDQAYYRDIEDIKNGDERNNPLNNLKRLAEAIEQIGSENNAKIALEYTPGWVVEERTSSLINGIRLGGLFRGGTFHTNSEPLLAALLRATEALRNDITSSLENAQTFDDLEKVATLYEKAGLELLCMDDAWLKGERGESQLIRSLEEVKKAVSAATQEGDNSQLRSLLWVGSSGQSAWHDAIERAIQNEQRNNNNVNNSENTRESNINSQ